MDTLLLIAELHAYLDNNDDPHIARKCWNSVLRIESSLESDPKYSKRERKIMASLRSTMSDVVGAFNDGLKPNITLVLVNLKHLESYLKRRTLGLDGFPLA